jgi:mannose-6-phosphate isomerase-like protein (cupin superfamily)
MNRTMNITVVPPEGGQNFTRPDTGGEVVVKLAAETSQGSLTIYESSRRAGDRRGPGPHRHDGFEEIFYVLTGEYVFEVEDQTIQAPARTLICIPPGALHTFTSVGEQDGRLLVVCEPGGIERFFEDVARHSSELKSDTVASIGRQHGIDFITPPKK